MGQGREGSSSFPPVRFYDIVYFMGKSIIKAIKKTGQPKRGRPATGLGVLIGARWQPEDVAAIDAYAGANKIKQTEAVRALVKLGLTVARRKRAKPQQE